MSGRFTERGSEAVNLIMSHWARLKVKLIDQLLGERARKSERGAADRPVIPSPFFFVSFQLLSLISLSTKTRHFFFIISVCHLYSFLSFFFLICNLCVRVCGHKSECLFLSIRPFFFFNTQLQSREFLVFFFLAVSSKQRQLWHIYIKCRICCSLSGWVCCCVWAASAVSS